MPCRSSRARWLLTHKKAIVVKYQPFTIKMLIDTEYNNQDVTYKIDPGSKTTGIVLVSEYKRGSVVIWAANLSHKLTVKTNLDERRRVRKNRRNRKLRYRPSRYNNRTRPKGWLPPSLMSKVNNITNWLVKLSALAPISKASLETVKFDTQKMMNPEISGVEYQQGELFGYDVREYLLEKYNRTCVYCDITNVPMEVEHIIPRSKGGSNRVSNLVIACHDCNHKKDNLSLEQFVTDKNRLLRIKSKLKESLKDVASVNSTRNCIQRKLLEFNLPLEIGTGSMTKMNRIKQGYMKDHWVDAACVGNSGNNVKIKKHHKPLLIKAMGRGIRALTRHDKFGFPIGKPKSVFNINGIQTGDIVKIIQVKGKHKGKYVARVSSIRHDGYIAIKKNITTSAIYFNAKLAIVLQKKDGYNYSI